MGPQCRTFLRATRCAPQQRLQPRQQLLHLERFGQVVVGAGLQALHLVLPAPARREHEDGQVAAALAQPADDVQAGEPGQADVDDGGVIGIFGGEIQRFLALAGGIDRVALRLELRADLLLQGRLVFHHQDTHRCLC